MRAWIKYKGKSTDEIKPSEHNYTRFGKPIPKHELEIDILRYFGVKQERGVYIANSLKQDDRIEVKFGEDTKTAIKNYKIPAERLNRNKSMKQDIPNIKTEVDINKLKEELKAELKKEMQPVKTKVKAETK